MKMKSFNVAGVTFKRAGQSATGLELISKYTGFGSTFVLEREIDNKYDGNAIMVKQEFKKSGNRVMLGYVPKKLAVEFAPLMDQHGWEPVVKFGRKFIDEKNDGECKGLQLRYEPR